MISGSGFVTKQGSGDLVLTGANTYAGGTFLDGGVLRFNTDSNLGAPGAQIVVSHNLGRLGTTANTPAGTTINRPLTLLVEGGIDVAANPITWSGVISGPGAFEKSGPGDLTLTGVNTYAGGTIVSGGVLRFNSDSALGASSSPVDLRGGSVGSTDDTVPQTVFSRNLQVSGSGGIDVALHPITWSGVISGSGQFVKSGSGVLQLTGANTYSGGTLVRDGVLWVTSDAQLGAAGTGVTLDGGTFRASEDFATSRPFTLIDTATSSSVVFQRRWFEDAHPGRGRQRRRSHQGRPRNARAQRRQYLQQHLHTGRNGRRQLDVDPRQCDV